VVAIGRVGRAHGVRGEVRVAADGGSLARLGRVSIGGAERKIESARPMNDAWLVKLEGVDDRDAAEALRGLPVLARREELPEAGEGEVYVADLVGCLVLDGDEPVGTVREVVSNGAQDLLVVERAGGEALVPFVEPIVVSVDLEARRIVCALPEGLVE
jgi:16S rRNA processing protein RimM